MLAALGTAALLFLGGWMLCQDGQFTVIEAVICVVALTAALVVALAFAARAKFREALKAKSKAVPEGEDPLKALVSGFLEGLLAKKQNRTEGEDINKKNPSTPNYPRAA
jgi:predicted Co/Zn/Cd cation transporter (cation efflux family)